MQGKPLSKSITIRAAVVILSVFLARLFAKYLPGELARELATGAADEIVAAVVTVGVGAVVYGRARLQKFLGAVAFVVVGSTGCAAGWPAQCVLTQGGGRRCVCTKYRIETPDKNASPRPVFQSCDGHVLPITVIAAAVTATTVEPEQSP